MITVLTATYNRSQTLLRLFQSLLAQTHRDFEWVIVDDGSTDETQAFFDRYLKSSNDLNITIIRQENGGKHSAINRGVALSKGKWVLIVDSDDALVPDAIETICAAVSGSNIETVGFCYRKAFFDNRMVGREVLSNDGYIITTPTDAGKIFCGDLAYVFRTDVMREKEFPIFPGEKFVPELYIWNKIGDEGQLIFFTEKVIYLCEYLEDGYSRNFSFYLKNNPRGFFVFYSSQICRETKLFYKVKYFLRSLQCILYMALRIGK